MTGQSKARPGHDQASFAQGIRHAVTWLHERARTMNDPHARQVLDAAAFALGQEQAQARALTQPSGGG